MLDWFASAVTSIGVAKDISQSLVNLRDAELVRSKVFELTNSLMELQQQLMNAQIEQMALVQQINVLRESLDQATKQSDRNDRYERYQFETGYFAYALKEEYRVSNVSHFLCSACFEKGEHITLHGKDAILHCPSCKQNIRATCEPPTQPPNYVGRVRIKS